MWRGRSNQCKMLLCLADETWNSFPMEEADVGAGTKTTVDLSGISSGAMESRGSSAAGPKGVGGQGWHNGSVAGPGTGRGRGEKKEVAHSLSRPLHPTVRRKLKAAVLSAPDKRLTPAAAAAATS
uniref:Uncharacterized protein n=1 Tax=Micrurus paraensis TaxID=1970185 RepID=A0A2D4KZU1_9SAUR